MRVDTLEQKHVESYLADNFVLVAHNQLPQLYCSCQSGKTPSNTGQNKYPEKQKQLVYEGAGGGNVRTFCCTPDGHVVHYLAGYWKEKQFRFETDWSLTQIAALGTIPWWTDDALTASLKAEHEKQLAVEETKRDQFMSPEEIEALIQALNQAKREQAKGVTGGPEQTKNAAAFHRLTGLNRLIRNRREAKDFVGRPIESVLHQIEEEVYTKGSVGCGS